MKKMLAVAVLVLAACGGVEEQLEPTPSFTGIAPTEVCNIVLVTDSSPGMGEANEKFKKVLRNWWASDLRHHNYKVAIVGAPSNEEFDYRAAPKVTLMQDFTDIDTAVNVFDTKVGSDGHNNVPTLDAMWQVAEADSELGLSWASSSKRVMVVISDIAPRSFGDKVVQQDELITKLNEASLPTHVFTDKDRHMVAESYGPISQGSGGAMYDLQMTEAQMHEKLNEVVQHCL